MGNWPKNSRSWKASRTHLMTSPCQRPSKIQLHMHKWVQGSLLVRRKIESLCNESRCAWCRYTLVVMTLLSRLCIIGFFGLSACDFTEDPCHIWLLFAFSSSNSKMWARQSLSVLSHTGEVYKYITHSFQLCKCIDTHILIYNFSYAQDFGLVNPIVTKESRHEILLHAAEICWRIGNTTKLVRYMGREKAFEQVLVGHDPSVLASLQAGLDGAIAATGSVMPETLLGIAAAHAAGDLQTAEDHLKRLNKWWVGNVPKAICWMDDAAITMQAA